MAKWKVDGARLKRARESRRLSQGQLATYASVEQGTISKIEAGQRGNISIDTLMRLATTLEIDPLSLVVGAKTPAGPERVTPIGGTEEDIRRSTFEAMTKIQRRSAAVNAESVLEAIRSLLKEYDENTSREG